MTALRSLPAVVTSGRLKKRFAETLLLQHEKPSLARDTQLRALLAQAAADPRYFDDVVTCTLVLLGAFLGKHPIREILYVDSELAHQTAAAAGLLDRLAGSLPALAEASLLGWGWDMGFPHLTGAGWSWQMPCTAPGAVLLASRVHAEYAEEVLLGSLRLERRSQAPYFPGLLTAAEAAVFLGRPPALPGGSHE